VAALGWLYARAPQSNVDQVAFTHSLAIPPLLEPTVDSAGRKVFDLHVTAGMTELLPDRQTETWGLNGPYLAPTLRASRGDEVVVNVTNGVDEPTTLHWHGMLLPAQMDGGPHQLIAAGDTWSPAWTIVQPAATLWFHPHLHERTAEHVYRGAAGMFILDDATAQALNLPDTYGVDDIPVIIQDKAFSSDGSLRQRTPLFSSIGILGNEILVNGTYGPVFEATTSLVRFRLLNGSTARFYNLGFTDDRPFAVIAGDSGLLEAPVDRTRLQLSPGERAEIVVAVAPGEEVMLRSFGANLGQDFFSERMNGGDDTFDILRIRAASYLSESPPLPQALAIIERPDPASAVTTRSFRLSGQRINGRQMALTRVDAVVHAGTTEIWEVEGGGGGPHNFHAHGVHFLVLALDGEAPPPHLRGWEDTIPLASTSRARLLVQFLEHADPVHPYMFHCHILRHEDRGMMSQFVVIEPGAQPPQEIPEPHDRHGLPAPAGSAPRGLQPPAEVSRLNWNQLVNRTRARRLDA
jgi:blue copper oxidase